MQCQDEDTWIASSEAMGIFPRCAMLQSRSGLTHLTIPTSQLHSCCADAKEEIPLGAPKPKGKPATVTSFCDADLCHDLVSGKSVTGIFHQLNKTPVNLCSKLQSTVETATFSSEHGAARTCTEQVIDLRLTL